MNKLIIFDLWQTLADAKIRPSILLDIFPAKPELKDFLDALLGSDLFLRDTELENALKVFLHNFGIDKKAEVDEAVSLWQKMAASSYLIDGAEKLISTLKSKGAVLSILTNVDKYGWEHFSYPDFVSKFDHVFLSYKEGMAKPDPKCWEEIHARSGFEYKDMIMVGDSLEYDILPARELGINTFHIKKEGDFNGLLKYLKPYLDAQA